MDVSVGMIVRCCFAVLAPVLNSLLIALDRVIGVNVNRLGVLVLKGRELGLVAMITRMGVLR